MRQVLARVREDSSLRLGLAPEGGDNPSGELCMPAPGLGRFCLLLAAAGLNFVPVGAFESEGSFRLAFGPPYSLVLPAGVPAPDRDHQAARQVMERIALLLPQPLRGEFR